MAPSPIQLLEADSAQVLVLMDNYSDLLLPGGQRVQRPCLAKDGLIPSTTLLAEHGLSLLITIERGVNHLKCCWTQATARWGCRTTWTCWAYPCQRWKRWS